MNRRTFLFTAAATGSLSVGASVGAGAAAEPRSKMGIAVTSYMSFGRPKDTLEFLEHANTLGAGGIQMPVDLARAGLYPQTARARARNSACTTR